MRWRGLQVREPCHGALGSLAAPPLRKGNYHLDVASTSCSVAPSVAWGRDGSTSRDSLCSKNRHRHWQLAFREGAKSRFPDGAAGLWAWQFLPLVCDFIRRSRRRVPRLSRLQFGETKVRSNPRCNDPRNASYTLFIRIPRRRARLALPCCLPGANRSSLWLHEGAMGKAHPWGKADSFKTRFWNR